METLHKTVKALSEASSIPQVLERFLQSQAGPCLYFSWVQNHSALQLLHSKPKISSGLIRLYESDSSFQTEDLKEPSKIKALRKLMQKISPEKKLFPFWIYRNKEPFGLFFLPNDSADTQSLLSYVELKCQSLSLKKQSSEEEFLKLLYTEISRSRRLGLPATLLLIRCSSKEPAFFQSLLNHLEKNRRIYDSMMMLNSKEIALLLPHTSEKAGLEKAEKIYWVLQSLNQTEILKTPLAFQTAVAEYPKSARDAASLLQLARDACAYGKAKKTGLVIAQAPEGFKPDFQAQNTDLCEWV